MTPEQKVAFAGSQPRADEDLQRWADAVYWQRPGTLQLPASPPLSLYVHLPWCIRKCPYCDFNSHAVTDGGQLDAVVQGRYLDALRTDLQASLPLVWGRTVHTVFFGGGTPSLFSPDAIGRFISDIRALLPLEPDTEITLEANPGTFETSRFKAFASAGVTRLSVGVQSFDDAMLKAIGRVHDGAQAAAAVEEAAQAFSTFNLDLMYALPGQSLAQCAEDVRRALSFSPPHLSLYHLTIEPNTFFAKHEPSGLPDDDDAYAMLDMIEAETTAAGMERYEVSALARTGHRCRHNLNYWQFGDYLGIGAGAHSKLSFAHKVVRQVRWREPTLYMDKALAGTPVTLVEPVSRRDLPFEFMLNALRLRDGFAMQWFAERTGLPVSSIDAGLELGQQKGWLEVDAGWVKPTAAGFDFLSDLQAAFLPE